MNERSERRGFGIGIDIGGTFVDAVVFDYGNARLRAFKLPTTPEDPAIGVIEAIGRLGVPAGEALDFVHGTTLGLNAILERKGATVGILTNRGFEDVFEIGRGNLNFADMYRFDFEPPEKIVERCRVRGVPGRIDAWGEEVEPLDDEALLASATELVEREGCTSLAVGFLHSYANGTHERRAVEILEAAFPGVDVSSGAALANEYREYERTSTAVLDAYVKPVLKRYLGRVAEGIESRGFRGTRYVMNSSGGALTFAMGEASPISTVQSGPAGGVAGARFLARSAGERRVLSVDIGGTSLDACLILDYEPTDVFEAEIDGFPILQPIYDIRNLGAGGGSVARVENALLKVGPESAGAAPGPACYGRGGVRPTVTDAALVLGYLDTSNFMGGEMEVAEGLAVEALRKDICAPLDIDEREAAGAVLDVVVSRVSSSVKEMLLERGLDPRDFTLLAFGGCGPLLGPMIQRELEMPEMLVPLLPSVFSAWGMMASDLTFDESVSAMEPVSDAALAKLRPKAEALTRSGIDRLRRSVGSDVEPRHRTFVRVRFVGQEHTLKVEYFVDDTEATLFGRFSAAHESRYGHSFDEPAEIVSLAVRLTLTTPRPEVSFDALYGDASSMREVTLFDRATGRTAPAQSLQRSALRPNRRLPGPVRVVDQGSSLVVHGDQELIVEESGTIRVRLRDSA